jgi:acetylserotonin N-methyltransferase
VLPTESSFEEVLTMKNMLPPTCDDRIIWDLHLSMYHFPTLAAADQVGIFVLLGRGPASAAQVAQELGLGLRGIEAMLGMLVALKLLVQHGERFYLTDVAQNYLLPESPYYYGPWLHVVREVKPSCATIMEALRRDAPTPLPFQPGKDGLHTAWESSAPDPAFLRMIANLMHTHSLPEAAGLASRGGLVGAKRLLDVAGGAGTFSIALALQDPALRCTVLDLPVVCEVTKETVAQYGLSDRIETQPANMFRDEWPVGHDTIFFADIFHDWPAPECQELSRRSFAALPSGGRIHIHELLLADTKDGPLPAAAYSIGMLLATRGRQYSFKEFAGFLEAAGFANVTMQTGYGYFSIVSATKP